MNKLALLKKVGKLAAKAAGVAGADDRVKRLEAEKKLLEMKLVVAVSALRDLIGACERSQGPGAGDRAVYDEMVEAREILGVVGGE